MDDSNPPSKIDRFESTEDILRAVSRIIDQNDGASSAPTQEKPPAAAISASSTPPSAPFEPAPAVAAATEPPATPTPPVAPAAPPPPPSSPARSMTKKKFSASPQAATFRGGKSEPPKSEPTVPQSEPSQAIEEEVSEEKINEADSAPKQQTPPPPQKTEPAVKEAAPALKPSTITETTPCLELTDMIDDNGTIISLPLIGTDDVRGVSYDASVKESVMHQLKGKISHMFTKEEKIDDVIELKAKEWVEKHMPQLVEQAIDQAMKKKTNHDNASKEF